MVDLTLSELDIATVRANTVLPPCKNLSQAQVNTPYTIRGIEANDTELVNFLFTLGCYEGEQITVISILAENYVINIKDARYSIDRELAQAILI